LFVNKDFKPKHRRNIGKIEKEKLFEYFEELLENINYPQHKKEKTKIMFKRIMGRAMPSKWEYHTSMGVLSNTLSRLKNKDTEKKK
jgi:tRNA C32,U32 (ribose-2'-O)-methylase TrmJ